DDELGAQVEPRDLPDHLGPQVAFGSGHQYSRKSKVPSAAKNPSSSTWYTPSVRDARNRQTTTHTFSSSTSSGWSIGFRRVKTCLVVITCCISGTWFGL